MGFGLLFIGYFLTYLTSVSYAGYLIRFVGYSVMLYSFTKLYKYNKSFLLPLYSSIALLVVTALDIYANVGEFLYNSLIIDSFSLPQNFALTLATVDDALVFVFHALLLFAIRNIAKETELPTLAYAAARNFAVICVYEVMCLIAFLPFDFVDGYKMAFGLPMYLLYFGWIILNLVLIFSCYAKICDENDVDMPLKKSKFEFINKFREETARREQKAADDSVEYAKQRLEKRKEERQRKKRR